MLNRLKIKFLIALFLVFGRGNFCFSQTKSYVIDSGKSEILFKVKHLGVLTVKGQFNNFSGNLVFSENTLQEIKCNIFVESIDTNNKTRDDSLLDEAYLDVQNYPIIDFRSTHIKLTSETKTITGNLKIKDVESIITMPYKMMKDGDSFQINITTTINRKDFNLDFGAMDVMIGDEIKIEIKIKTN